MIEQLTNMFCLKPRKQQTMLDWVKQTFLKKNDDENNESCDESSSHLMKKSNAHTKTISASPNKNIGASQAHTKTTPSRNPNTQQRRTSGAPTTSQTNHQHRKPQHTSKSHHMSEEAHTEVDDHENNLMSKCKNLTHIYKSESAKAFRDVKGKIGSKLKMLANNTKLSPSANKLQSLHGESSFVETSMGNATH